MKFSINAIVFWLLVLVLLVVIVRRLHLRHTGKEIEDLTEVLGYVSVAKVMSLEDLRYRLKDKKEDKKATSLSNTSYRSLIYACYRLSEQKRIRFLTVFKSHVGASNAYKVWFERIS